MAFLLKHYLILPLSLIRAAQYTGVMAMLITATQFKLARARKSLEKAHLSKDWCELKRCDGDLADCLNAAFEDGSRDAKVLVNELEYILAVYARIINDLPEDVVKNMPDIQLTTRGID